MGLMKNGNNKKNLLFILPQAPSFSVYPWYLREERHSAEDTSYCLPPAMASSILGCLREKVNGVNIHFVDLQLRDYTRDELLRHVKNISPEFIVAVVSANLLDVPSERMVLELGVETLCVLTPVQTDPEEAVSKYNIKCKYFTCTDEVEMAVSNAVKEYFSAGDISHTPGLYINKNKSGFFTDSSKIYDITRLPMPAYDLINADEYIREQQNSGEPRAVIINTMKGCPFSCSFCSVGSSKFPGRMKTAKQMFEEIYMLHRDYGVDWFYFLNSEFSANRKIAKEFCRRVINSGIKIRYNVKERIECVNEEILHLMKESGANIIYYGIETADSRIQAKINKRLNLDRCIKVIQDTKKEGLRAVIYMMLGLPGEDEDTLRKNIEFVVRARPDGVVWTILFPEHGSPLFEELKESGQLLSEVWSDYRRYKKLSFKHNYYKSIKDVKKAKYLVQMKYRLELFKQKDFRMTKRLYCLFTFLVTLIYSIAVSPVLNKSPQLFRLKELMKVSISRIAGPVL